MKDRTILVFLTLLLISWMCFIIRTHSPIKYISLPEEICQVDKGDTLIITDKGDYEDIEFYHGGSLKKNEQLFIVKGFDKKLNPQ